MKFSFSSLLLFFIIFNAHHNNAALIKLTDEKQFDALIKRHEIVIVDFYAPWCGPCHQANAFFSQFSQTYPNVTIIQVNSDIFHGLANRFQIRSIPTFFFYKHGVQITAIPNKNGVVRNALVGWDADYFNSLFHSLLPEIKK